jgi:hypothetical protein
LRAKLNRAEIPDRGVTPCRRGYVILHLGISPRMEMVKALSAQRSQTVSHKANPAIRTVLPWGIILVGRRLLSISYAITGICLFKSKTNLAGIGRQVGVCRHGPFCISHLAAVFQILSNNLSWKRAGPDPSSDLSDRHRNLLQERLG